MTGWFAAGKEGIPLAALALALSFGISGCAGHSPRTQRLLDEATPAKQVSELARHKLAQDEKRTHEITEDSQAFAFETGKSYAVLFELPEFKESSTLELKSYCDCFGFTKNVFIPIAVLLDGSFKKTGELEFVTHAPTMAEPVHFVSETALGKGDKYALVYSDPKSYGKPAARVSVDVTTVRKEKLDYIRKGLVQETYSTSKAGVWWKGHSVGKIRAWVKSPNK